MEELLEGTAPREELERAEAELARVAAALEEARRQHVNDMEDVLEGTVPRDEHEALQAALRRLAEEAAELRRQAEEPAGADKAELEASRQEAARLRCGTSTICWRCSPRNSTSTRRRWRASWARGCLRMSSCCWRRRGTSRTRRCRC